uniref:Uncharacterized protein n=1 Tax=Globodera rostochiensis TaxID=31243 RepID=A0A914H155_GLORO
MLFKIQSAPANLNSHSENPNNSSESLEQLEGIEENQQQQDDYQSCHYVLQWWHYNSNISIGRSRNQQLANKRMPSWIDFIMVVIFERNMGARIEAYVRHEREAVVELCLCNSNKSCCDGPFEAKQKYGGKIDLKRPQCIKFDYQTIMEMNLKKKTANNEFLYILDEFGINKNSKSSDESNNQQESSSCSVTEPPLSFHRQLFMRIAYESATTKKSFGIWRLRKNDEFELILWE